MAARSLKVKKYLVPKVKAAVRRNGFAGQSALADAAGVSLSTVSSFLNGRSVDFVYFAELCERLRIDWEAVADIDLDSALDKPEISVAELQSFKTLIKDGTENWNNWREKYLATPLTISSVDLSETDLSGVNLSQANLSGVDFSGNDLSKVNFYSSNLNDVNFKRADLSQVNFSKANLNGVDFSKTNVSEANFNSSKLNGLDFSYARLRSVNFSSAELNNVNFRFSDLTKANFYHALIKNSDFSRTQFEEVNCKYAILHKADFRLSSLNSTNLSQADLSNADLNCASLVSTNLSYANLSNANLENANLSEANLRGAQAIRTNFRNAQLTGACIENWNISDETIFDGVLCDYIYLKGNQQERRPRSGIFAHGEFAKLFQKLTETIDFLFNKRIDWKAFATVFEELRQVYDDNVFSIQTIESKGDSTFLIRIIAVISLVRYSNSSG